MAALLTLTSRKSLPYLTGFTLASTAALVYTYARPSSGHSLDSAQNPPTNLLSLPRTLVFAQTLTVTKTEQINHDTKRITFSLPRGENQVSGVPAGCKSLLIIIIIIIIITKASNRTKKRPSQSELLLLLTHTATSRHSNPTYPPRSLVPRPPTLHPHQRAVRPRNPRTAGETVPFRRGVDASPLFDSGTDALGTRPTSRLRVHSAFEGRGARVGVYRGRGGDYADLFAGEEGFGGRGRSVEGAFGVGREWGEGFGVEEGD